MTKKTSNRFSPEVRQRAVRMVLEHGGDHASQWSAIGSIAAKIGCTAETLRKWVRQAERDQGLRAGPTTAEQERIKTLEREVRELRQANEILRKASAYFAMAELDRPLEAMIAFIDDHREVYGVEPICRILQIAPSTYHARLAQRADAAKASPRTRHDLVLMEQIRRVHAANFGVYGARKIWRQLAREGIAVARCTVERLMRQIGLRGAVRGKETRTTIADKAAPCPADKVNRQFRAPQPNVFWVSDFPSGATWQGFVYVPFVIDVFPRRIVGWRVSRTAHA